CCCRWSFSCMNLVCVCVCVCVCVFETYEPMGDCLYECGHVCMYCMHDSLWLFVLVHECPLCVCVCVCVFVCVCVCVCVCVVVYVCVYGGVSVCVYAQC